MHIRKSGRNREIVVEAHSVTAHILHIRNGFDLPEVSVWLNVIRSFSLNSLIIYVL